MGGLTSFRISFRIDLSTRTEWPSTSPNPVPVVHDHSNTRSWTAAPVAWCGRLVGHRRLVPFNIYGQVQTKASHAVENTVFTMCFYTQKGKRVNPAREPPNGSSITVLLCFSHYEE